MPRCQDVSLQRRHARLHLLRRDAGRLDSAPAVQDRQGQAGGHRREPGPAAERERLVQRAGHGHAGRYRRYLGDRVVPAAHLQRRRLGHRERLRRDRAEREREPRSGCGRRRLVQPPRLGLLRRVRCDFRDRRLHLRELRRPRHAGDDDLRELQRQGRQHLERERHAPVRLDAADRQGRSRAWPRRERLVQPPGCGDGERLRLGVRARRLQRRQLRRPGE